MPAPTTTKQLYLLLLAIGAIHAAPPLLVFFLRAPHARKLLKLVCIGVPLCFMAYGLLGAACPDLGKFREFADCRFPFDLRLFDYLLFWTMLPSHLAMAYMEWVIVLTLLFTAANEAKYRRDNPLSPAPPKR